jgi:outer membrane lipoprotein LolB
MIRLTGATLLWLWIVLGVGGCAVLSPQSASSPSTQAWDNRRAELIQLDHWLLQARIASGRVGWSGSLRWRQDEEDFDIRVSGPLGTGGFQARGNPGQVEIRTPRETVVTQDPAALLLEKVGWTLPLQQLRYWAVGVPYPSTPAVVRYDAAGRLQRLEQDGWVLEYTEYGRYQHYELPNRFSLDSGDSHFRVVVDDWSEVG